MSTRPKPEIVLGSGLTPDGLADISVTTYADFLAKRIRRQPDEVPRIVLVGRPPLAIFLDKAEHAKAQADQDLLDLLTTANIALIRTDADNLQAKMIAHLSSALQRVETSEQEHRAALAALRIDAQQAQSNLAALDGFIHDALLPPFALHTNWPPTAGAITLGSDPIHQPLPVPSRGFIAVDIHIAQSATGGAINAALTSVTGAQVCQIASPISAGYQGWHRLQLPIVPDGPPEDLTLSLTCDGLTLSLAPDTEFPDLRATETAPLALRLYRTLPGASLPVTHPPQAIGQTRLLLPNDLPEPQLLPYLPGKLPRALRRTSDPIRLRQVPEDNAILLRPSARRPAVCKIPDIMAEDLKSILATIHVARTDSFPISFAVGAAPAGQINAVASAYPHLGDWLELLPGGWGQVQYRAPEPLSGPIDLLLATGLPNAPFNTGAAAQFRGFRLRMAK